MPDIEREHKVINNFCERLSLLTGSAVEVLSWPDEENKGKQRKQGESFCDAIIRRNSEELALDHRQIESFHDHFKDNARFESVVVPLQKSLSGIYPEHRIRIALSVRGLPNGFRDKMRKNLQSGCLRTVHDTPDDCRVHKHLIPEVPCEVWISKTPSKQPGCYVSRHLPQDQKSEIQDGLFKAIESKSIQLGRYKDKGINTILLLDSDDFSSVDEYTIGQIFAEAIGQRNIPSIDEVYLYHSCQDDFIVLPLKILNNYFPNIEDIDNMMDKQYKQ